MFELSISFLLSRSLLILCKLYTADQFRFIKQVNYRHTSNMSDTSSDIWFSSWIYEPFWESGIKKGLIVVCNWNITNMKLIYLDQTRDRKINTLVRVDIFSFKILHMLATAESLSFLCKKLRISTTTAPILGLFVLISIYFTC